MSADELDDAIEEAEERVGWALGMRAENQGLRIGIHRAIDALEKGDLKVGLKRLRKLVGRKERKS